MDSLIDQSRNDMFSSLRGHDLQDLLSQIDRFLIDYRPTLNLNDNIQFGLEIEYEGLSLSVVEEFVSKNLDNWKTVEDRSLYFGGEVNSPIMKDELKYWKELRKICRFLSSKKVNTSRNAAGHIHLGACGLGDDMEAWRLFLKLYMVYESVFFRFAYGDKINARREILRFARPSSSALHDILPQINRVSKVRNLKIYGLPSSYAYALNFTYVDFVDLEDNKVKNTLEFRSFNATVNEIIWQNNVNTTAKMLMSSKDKVIDEEFLDYKLKNEYVGYFGNEYMYNEVNLKDALEFVDIVFDNNLDKVCFLKQYIKNFQSSYGLKTTKFAKKLTR